MRRFIYSLAVLMVTAGGVGCRAHTNEAAEPQAVTTLRVDNQAFLDMAVYVLSSSSARQRLGTATGNSTTNMVIPANLIFGTTQLRFVADPIGGNHASVSSTISVNAGDTVVMTIPPS